MISERNYVIEFPDDTTAKRTRSLHNSICRHGTMLIWNITLTSSSSQQIRRKNAEWTENGHESQPATGLTLESRSVSRLATANIAS